MPKKVFWIKKNREEGKNGFFEISRDRGVISVFCDVTPRIKRYSWGNYLLFTETISFFLKKEALMFLIVSNRNSWSPRVFMQELLFCLPHISKGTNAKSHSRFRFRFFLGFFSPIQILPRSLFIWGPMKKNWKKKRKSFFSFEISVGRGVISVFVTSQIGTKEVLLNFFLC